MKKGKIENLEDAECRKEDLRFLLANIEYEARLCRDGIL